MRGFHEPGAEAGNGRRCAAVASLGCAAACVRREVGRGLQWEAELGRCEDWCARFIAERNGRPIGFVQILDAAREPTRYWGEVPEGTLAIDLWIGVESELGRGYGSEMMRQALQRCFDASGTQRVVVDPLAANTRAHRFYRRFGFRPLERRRLGTDECLVHALTRAAWEAVVQRFR